MRRLIGVVVMSVLAMLILPAVAWAQDTLATVAEETAEGSVGEILTLLSAVAGSLVLGAIKKWTTLLDNTWLKLIKPIQPMVVAGAALLIPLLLQRFGVDLGDAGPLVDAPTATVIVVVLREVKEALKKWLGDSG